MYGNCLITSYKGIVKHVLSKRFQVGEFDAAPGNDGTFTVEITSEMFGQYCYGYDNNLKLQFLLQNDNQMFDIATIVIPILKGEFIPSKFPIPGTTGAEYYVNGWVAHNC